MKQNLKFLQKLPSYIFFIIIFALLNLRSSHAITLKERNEAQQILDHFCAISMQVSNFVQTDWRGVMHKGKLYLLRPGKIRFFYDDLPLNVICDGHNVLINNTDLNSYSLYNLALSPMKILLSNHIDANSKLLSSLNHRGDDIILSFKDSNGILYLSFNAKTYDLKNWVIIDRQNHPTKIEILDALRNVQYPKEMFAIPYQTIATQRARANH